MAKGKIAKDIDLHPLHERLEGVKEVVKRMRDRAGTTVDQRRALNLYIRELGAVQHSILAVCSPRTPRYWI